MASSPESKSMEVPGEVEVASEQQGKTEQKESSRPLPLQPPPPPPCDVEGECPLARQSTIYSLTLDEIKNTVCEQGKSFGSMNMDEFLTNIWNAEESAGAAQAQPAAASEQLNRQGSLSLSSPLCRKTVSEVWAEIYYEQQQGPEQRSDRPVPADRQLTFGEMTLEDFLIKAGVVREGHSHGAAGGSPAPQPLPVPALPQYALANYAAGTEIGHVVGVGAAAYGSELGYGGAIAGGGSEGMMGNGYVPGGGRNIAGMFESPASPISSDEMCGCRGGPLDAFVLGMEGGPEMIAGGRKRLADGVLEKVVDRRQRRMIKNRESAARSRARKQVSTVSGAFLE
ncbi:Protein abscisic acid-insensitive 5 [Apostasia shenzhenica]|uniref:Protein abscisic acid-insensitive 5 n=1 Tax=Apostasia shenzhenica TaxID=1088818 RepID=A0A2I0BHA7_9ASPA|nr:Protein abscisic acid-insensitive 5 [Apostasia shenzhenica]